MDFILGQSSFITASSAKIAGLAIASFAVMAFLFMESHDEESDDHQEKEGSSKRPAGIFNEGNTCFVNSLMQALASLKTFKHSLQSLFEQNSLKLTDDEHLLFSLKNSLQKINSEEDKVQIVDFLNILGDLHANIINLQQQDAHELYSILVNSFDNVMSERKRPTLAKSTFSTNSNESEKEFNSFEYESEKVIQNPLLGYTKTSFTCVTCQVEKNIKIQPFYDLSFDIAPGQIRTIEDAMKNFQNKQIINGWICTKCSIDLHIKKVRKAIDELGKVKDGCEYGEVMIDIGNRIIEFCKRMPTEDIEMKQVNQRLYNFEVQFQNQYARIGQNNIYRERIFSIINPIEKTIVKQTIITKFPKILVLHFKQLCINPYTGQPYLLRKFINFSEQLKIGVRNGTKEYTLTSLLSHMGNQAMGHYYTFRKINQQENEWYVLSDTSSRRCQPEFLKRNVPYMLFYELKMN